MIQPITIGRATIYHADCLVALAQLPENSIDAVVTDPPYGLAFMGKGWDTPDNVAFRAATWRAVFRALKPGGHLVAFSGTRTYHRMVCAIEDAGFEIRDQLAWVYGSGFPKSHDLAKAIDKAQGVDVGTKVAGGAASTPTATGSTCHGGREHRTGPFAMPPASGRAGARRSSRPGSPSASPANPSSAPSRRTSASMASAR